MTGTEIDVARTAQIVALAVLALHFCVLRRWHAKADLLLTIEQIEEDLRADVDRRWLAPQDPSVDELRRCLTANRRRPGSAPSLSLLALVSRQRQQSGGTSSALEEYLAELVEATTTYLRVARPFRSWLAGRYGWGVVEASPPTGPILLPAKVPLAELLTSGEPSEPWPLDDPAEPPLGGELTSSSIEVPTGDPTVGAAPHLAPPVPVEADLDEADSAEAELAAPDPAAPQLAEPDPAPEVFELKPTTGQPAPTLPVIMETSADPVENATPETELADQPPSAGDQPAGDLTDNSADNSTDNSARSPHRSIGDQLVDDASREAATHPDGDPGGDDRAGEPVEHEQSDAGQRDGDAGDGPRTGGLTADPWAAPVPAPRRVGPLNDDTQPAIAAIRSGTPYWSGGRLRPRRALEETTIVLPDDDVDPPAREDRPTRARASAEHATQPGHDPHDPYEQPERPERPRRTRPRNRTDETTDSHP